ncbi:hypothetical protein Aduo_010968 [Ancylostoma duodenale]
MKRPKLNCSPNCNYKHNRKGTGFQEKHPFQRRCNRLRITPLQVFTVASCPDQEAFRKLSASSIQKLSKCSTTYAHILTNSWPAARISSEQQQLYRCQLKLKVKTGRRTTDWTGGIVSPSKRRLAEACTDPSDPPPP